MKHCKHCGITKPLEDFWNECGAKDGKQSRCKSCKNRLQRQRRAEKNPVYTCNNCGVKYRGRLGWSSSDVCSPECSKGRLKQQNQHCRDMARLRKQEEEARKAIARKARAAAKAEKERLNQIALDAGFCLCKQCGCLPLESFTPSGIKNNICAECNRQQAAEHHRKNPDRLWARKQRRRREKASDNGTSKQIPAAQRTKVLEAANWICYYCGIKTTKPIRDENNKGYTPTEAHIDHIIPIKRGGTNETSNLCCSCGGCNLSKGAKI